MLSKKIVILFLILCLVYSPQTIPRPKTFYNDIPLVILHTLAMGLKEQKIKPDLMLSLFKIASNQFYAPSQFELGLLYVNSEKDDFSYNSMGESLIACAAKQDYKPALYYEGISLLNNKKTNEGVLKIIQACGPYTYTTELPKKIPLILFYEPAYRTLENILKTKVIDTEAMSKNYIKLLQKLRWEDEIIVHECIQKFIKKDFKNLLKLFKAILVKKDEDVYEQMLKGKIFLSHQSNLF